MRTGNRRPVSEPPAALAPPAAIPAPAEEARTVGAPPVRARRPGASFLRSWLLWSEVIALLAGIALWVQHRNSQVFGSLLPAASDRWVILGVAALLILLPLVPLSRAPLGRRLPVLLAYPFRRRSGLVERPQPAPAPASVSESGAIIRAGAVTRSGTRPSPSGLPTFFELGEVTSATSHDGREFGAVEWNGRFAVVLVADPNRRGITSTGVPPAIPVEVVARALLASGVQLESAQILTHTYPASAALPAGTAVARAQAALAVEIPGVQRRATAVVLRLDPRQNASAVAARGGRSVGTVRLLAAAASRLISELAPLGVVLRPLDGTALARDLPAWAELPVRQPDVAPRWRERWGRFEAAGLVHRSYAIGPMSPTARRAVAGLADLPALAATLSITLTPAGETVRVGAAFRFTCEGTAEVASLHLQVRAISRRGGIKLVGLGGAQRAGLLATLPLGGPRP